MNETKQKGNKMADMPMERLVLNVSGPLMISMVVQSLYNIVDGIFVSRISENALTATSLAYPAQMLMLAVAVGTGVGINALLSKKLGAGDLDAANQVATEGVILALLSSVLFIVFGIFGAGAFIKLFSSETKVLPLGTQYLRICMILCPGIFLGTTGERLLQATGNTHLSMFAQAVGAVVNILLDPILIFGLFGLPFMGIAGAAIATVIGQWVAAAIALWLNKKRNTEIQFRFKGYHPDKELIRGIYKVGIPMMITQTMGSLMMIGMNKILVNYNLLATTAFGVYYKLYTFLYMPISGLAQGQLPIIGFNYGAKNGVRIKQAFKITLISAIVIMMLGTAVFEIMPVRLLGLYNASDEMMVIGIPLLRVMGATFPIAAVTIVIGFCCSGLSNGMVSMLGMALRQLIVMVPVAIIFGGCFGLDHIWYASWISEVVAAIYAIAKIKSEFKKKVQPIL